MFVKYLIVVKYFVARSTYETILSQKAHLKQMFRNDTCKSWKKDI